MTEKITSITSILLVILKEVRLERNIHQAQVADWCGKTPSAWTKIETGKVPLSIEILLRVCSNFGTPASAFLSAAERYASVLSQQGWGITNTPLEPEEDSLLAEVAQYYSSIGFRQRLQTNPYLSILNGPTYNYSGMYEIAEVFLFLLNEDFRCKQLGEKTPKLSSIPLS